MPKLIIPVESMKQSKGGVILYDPQNNEIEKQYIHPQRTDVKRSGWRGGTLFGNYLIASDWTDLHYFDITNWKYLYKITKNTFNDLHYLMIQNNSLFVVNTGLDAIERFKNPLNPKPKDFKFIFNTNKRFSKRDIDLSQKFNDKLKIKPHVAHPNCICPVEDKLFVTCFENETRKENTGCVIDINSGKILLDNINCHDGNYYNGNLYFSHTRKNSVLVVKNPLKKKWPVKVDEEIKIGKPCWWRGMVISKGKIYLFCSKGYNGKAPVILATIDLKSRSVKFSRLPIVKNLPWDTVYQPLLYRE